MVEKQRGESTVWSAGLHTKSWNDGHAGTPLKQAACDSMSLLHCMCSKTNRLPAHAPHGVGWTATAVYWYGTGSSGVWSLAKRHWTGFHYVNVICHTVCSASHLKVSESALCLLGGEDFWWCLRPSLTYQTLSHLNIHWVSYHGSCWGIICSVKYS